MPAEFYLKSKRPQRLYAPRYLCPDAPAWDQVECRYLCTGAQSALGGFEARAAFPGAANFYITGLETEPVTEGLYYVTLKGEGVKQKRLYTRTLPGANTVSATNVTVSGVAGPNTDGSWPSAELFVPALGFEVTYVGADSYGDASANNPATKIGKAVSTPITIPGFPPVFFPPAPPNPWSGIPAATAKLLYPFGWVVTRAEGPSLIAGSKTAPHLLTLGYQYRWKVVPGGS